MLTDQLFWSIECTKQQKQLAHTIATGFQVSEFFRNRRLASSFSQGVLCTIIFLLLISLTIPGLFEHHSWTSETAFIMNTGFHFMSWWCEQAGVLLERTRYMQLVPRFWSPGCHNNLMIKVLFRKLPKAYTATKKNAFSRSKWYLACYFF